ncbi:MAG: transposase [Rhodothermales bacterium]|jgi:transposase
MKIKLLGIDLAKNVFQLCALNQANKVIFNRSVRRARFRTTIAQLDPTIIAMESCSSAHYWGRAIETMGHKVLLIPAQHVTPFVRGGKSDARDALAICEAAQRPDLHPVPIKSIEQQDIQLLHRLRQRQVQHSTALANQIRSLGREYGVIFPTGIRSLITCLPEALEDGSNELSPVARHALADQYQCLIEVRQTMKTFQGQIEQLAAQYPAYNKLQALPGIGPLTGSAYIAAIGNGRQFQCGRQVSAWLGLVPRQYGSGGQIQLKGMTKNGDRYLRTLMIHGARAAITRGQKNCPPLAQWIQPIIARSGHNKAVVALANKLARIAWVVVTSDEPFDLKQAFKPAA